LYYTFGLDLLTYAILYVMKAVIHFLEKQNRLFWGMMGVIFVILVGCVDYRTGHELNIEFFYLVPIFLVTWFAGGRLGLVISATSAVTWFIADLANGRIYSNLTIYVWNTLIRSGFFIVVSFLLSALRKAYLSNRQLARTDYVTGAVSVSYFYELAQLEISRFQRYPRPFTLVYIDLDNFKTINDRLGHIAGDNVLRAVTENVQRQIRPADIFARLGGDEFALLLPETGEEEARKAIARIQSNLLIEMSKNGWMVTFSIGVVTYTHVPKSVDEMVRETDDVMYSVKTASKNGVNYRVYAG